MSKKFKSQASSARAAFGSSVFGAFATEASPLSYISEQPDVSTINDPHIVVALKNVAKKDSVTKQKGLEELLDDKSSGSYTEFAVLTAWSDTYPRTAIDNSVAVRRNAHVLQGRLTTSAGKTIVPLLPNIIPTWLAGTFDSDKSVAKAANDALEQAFSSSEKRQALWKIYKDAISDRVEDSLLVQTANTLSDERHTSPDEAAIKYARVVGMGCRLLSHLLSLDIESSVLQEKSMWELVQHEDGYIRSSISALLSTALQKESIASQLDWSALSTCFIYKALNRSQIGSMRPYLTALNQLTRLQPAVWTTHYSAKTSVLKRLSQFLRLGSQNGPEDVWNLVTNLIMTIPIEAWKGSNDDISTIADSLRIGISKERLYIDAAWQCYLQISNFLCQTISDEKNRDDFVEQNILPLVISYLRKSTEDSWKVGGRSEKTALTAMSVIAAQSKQAYEKLWSSLTDDTISKVKLSLPETARDFKSSQDSVAAQGKRLSQLRTSVKNESTITTASTTLLHEALEILKSRNGKPYGAAAIVAELGPEMKEDEKLQDFLKNDLESLITSPSSQQLIALALATNTSITEHLLSVQSPSSELVKSIQYLLKRASKGDLDQHSNAILQQINNFESEISTSYFAAILSNPNSHQSQLLSGVLTRLLSALRDAAQQARALAALETISSSPSLLKIVNSSEQGQDISSRLLVLADSQDLAFADQARAIVTALTSSSGASAGSLSIIRQQLSGTGEAISILSLTDLGLAYKETSNALDMLPSATDWKAAIESHLISAPPSALTVTSPLHGVVWTITGSEALQEKIVRDAEQFSQLFRIVFFVTKILSKDDAIEVNASEDVDALIQSYPTALQLINDKLTLDDANEIWLGSTEEVLAAAADILSEGFQLLRHWQQNETFASIWLSKLDGDLQNPSPKSYYESLVCTKILSTSLDQNSRDIMQKYETKLSKLHKSSELLSTASLLSASAEYLLGSQTGLTMVNELIVEITADPISNNTANLIYLNILLRSDNSILSKVPQQRIVLLLQKMVSFVRDAADGMNQLSESFVLLSTIVPFVQDIFGEYWEEILASLDDSWQVIASDDIALIHSSLLTYSQLKRVTQSEEVNDDLIEALANKKTETSRGLIQCLRALSKPSCDIDQPRTICAEILRRQLRGIEIDDNAELYALLESSIAAVRGSAYDVLHRSIPEKQAQLSIDLALEEQIVQLPKELLELIGDTSPMESYMLSWKLVFDHYTNASHKLKMMYTESLKYSDRVSHLLSFLCERLGITSGRPLMANKMDATRFELNQSDLDSHATQSLSLHLYFLALTHTSGLVKEWYLNQKNNIKTPLKSWTQKHITPLIVDTSLQAVMDWADTQDKDDLPVEIKASNKAAEVIASIKIDPESPPAALSITLPAAYPLESPIVVERTRVGVSERTFVSWVRTIQIIIFSSGNVVEGLVAFRKNVQGALKGQSECAICYSVIGTDMQTPNKKCGTCKNMFHGVCLFKWFKSSNSSSCPLCRNNFNYA